MDHGNGNHLDCVSRQYSPGSSGVDFRRRCSVCGMKKEKKGGTFSKNAKSFTCKECKDTRDAGI